MKNNDEVDALYFLLRRCWASPRHKHICLAYINLRNRGPAVRAYLSTQRRELRKMHRV